MRLQCEDSSTNNFGRFIFHIILAFVSEKFTLSFVCSSSNFKHLFQFVVSSQKNIIKFRVKSRLLNITSHVWLQQNFSHFLRFFPQIPHSHKISNLSLRNRQQFWGSIPELSLTHIYRNSISWPRIVVIQEGRRIFSEARSKKKNKNKPNQKAIRKLSQPSP